MAQYILYAHYYMVAFRDTTNHPRAWATAPTIEAAVDRARREADAYQKKHPDNPLTSIIFWKVQNDDDGTTVPPTDDEQAEFVRLTDDMAVSDVYVAWSLL